MLAVALYHYLVDDDDAGIVIALLLPLLFQC